MRIPAASRIGDRRPSAPTSKGAQTTSPESCTLTSWSPRTISSGALFHLSSILAPATQRAWSAARRLRFSCITPSGSPSAPGSKVSAPGRRPSATRMAWIGQPGSGSSASTPQAASIRPLDEATAVVRPSKAALVRGVGSAGSITVERSPALSSAAASASPTIPPPRMITSVEEVACCVMEDACKASVAWRHP